MQTYFMVGAGGTGTHLLPPLLHYLRAYHGNRDEEYQVVIADGDHYEQKNLARQLFPEAMAGMNKADAMVHAFPGHPIMAVTRYIGENDISTMIQDGDIVLICADNHSVRSLIVDHCNTLDEVVVINAGNEVHSGSVQLWVRYAGQNQTPSLRYSHPEIRYVAEDDRAPLTCMQAAAIPGGEQTLLANMTAATYMLTALTRYHQGLWQSRGNGVGWTELQYDFVDGVVEHLDLRERRNWDAVL